MLRVVVTKGELYSYLQSKVRGLEDALDLHQSDRTYVAEGNPSEIQTDVDVRGRPAEVLDEHPNIFSVSVIPSIALQKGVQDWTQQQIQECR